MSLGIQTQALPRESAGAPRSPAPAGPASHPDLGAGRARPCLSLGLPPRPSPRARPGKSSPSDIKRLGLSVMISEKWYYFGLGRITDYVEPFREARHKWCRQDKQDYLERNSITHARKRNRITQASCNVKQP